MADNGINWGKVVLGALGITAVALVAPSVLNGVADMTLGEGVTSAAPNAPFLDQVGEMARGAATSLSSTYAGAATSLGVAGTNFSSLGGVYDALYNAGGQAIEWVGANQKQAALMGGAALATGAVVGQWASRTAGSSAKPSAPGSGMSYAQYVEARRRMAAAAPPARTA